MGYLFHAIKFPVITTSFFLNVWSQLKWMIIVALTHLGIYKLASEEDDSTDKSNNYIFLLDGVSPSLVPIPIQFVTAAIKNRVPVVQYRDLLLNRVADQLRQQVNDKLCTVCLESLEATQEVNLIPGAVPKKNRGGSGRTKNKRRRRVEGDLEEERKKNRRESGKGKEEERKGKKSRRGSGRAKGEGDEEVDRS